MMVPTEYKPMFFCHLFCYFIPIMMWEQNLKERKKTTVGQLLQESSNEVILQSPFDFGVIRNGGRRGARHAPASLLNPFLKMATHQKISLSLKKPIDSMGEDLENFDHFQEREVSQFTTLLGQPYKRILHLGGGHDHVYPFVKAISENLPTKDQKVIIINIDAHLDTRADGINHSGTPFRQIFREIENKVEIYQIGIHPYANIPENYQDMGEMKFFEVSELSIFLKLLNERTQNSKDLLLLSLDCDGLDASIMPAVSAPNHSGLNKVEFQSILTFCQDYWLRSQTPHLYGVYEYNPLYDDLAGSSARLLASSFYQFFFRRI